MFGIFGFLFGPRSADVVGPATNPATGLSMIGASDIAGNAFGSNSLGDSMSCTSQADTFGTMSSFSNTFE